MGSKSKNQIINRWIARKGECGPVFNSDMGGETESLRVFGVL